MIEVVHISRLELAFAPRPWAFAEERRDDIARHFDQLKQVKPALWNGGMLLLHDYAIEGDVFRGAYFETDYASFVAWRDWGFPDATVRHCFSLGALRASDGSFLLGVMNSHTLNAGKIYFPTGVPDRSDMISLTEPSILLAAYDAKWLKRPGLMPTPTSLSRLGIASPPGHTLLISSCFMGAKPQPRCMRASERISRARRTPNSPTSASCAVPPTWTR
jgi:hypothetical protein